MAYLHRLSDLNTGIVDIDTQHRRIVGYIKDVYADYASTARQSLNRQGEIRDQTGGWISDTQRKFLG